MQRLLFSSNILGLLFISALFSACSPEERTFNASGGGAGGAGGNATSGSSSVTTGTQGGTCASEADCPGEPNTTVTCDQGMCAYKCTMGFSDCDATIPGCELPTSNDAKNCGACGTTCGLACENSVCVDPVDVATGFQHACALMSNGQVYCWGANSNGEVGDGKLEAVISVPLLVNLPGKAIQIAAGGGSLPMFQGGHTCALMEDGTVQCWGSDALNQLGLGVNDFNDPFPQPVVGIVNAIKIATGGAHTCALKKSGDLFCWGANGEGQIGTGVTSPSVEQPFLALSDVKDVSLGHQHTCAIRNSDGLFCWGDNYAGMLGTQAPNQHATPMKSKSLPANVDQVSLGQSHTCARVGNELYCWGADYQSQTGLGNFTTVEIPTIVTVPDVRFIDVGNVFSGTISGDAGEVRMWGFGPMGDTSTSQTTPTLNGLSGVEKLSLGGGYGDEGFACALFTSKQLACWGADGMGQIGDGPDNANKSKPVAVAFPVGMMP